MAGDMLYHGAIQTGVQKENYVQQLKHVKTRFADLSWRQALLVLACTVTFLLLALLSTRGTPVIRTATNQDSDVKMYRRVVNRLQAGEGYYDALGDELRRGRYSSRSVFNWRTPFFLSAIAFMSEPFSRFVLAIAAMAAIGMATTASARAGGDGGLQLVVTSLAVVQCFLFGYDFHLDSEVWAGILLLMSIAAYAFSSWRLAVACGILALFIRELTLPYVLVSMAFAIRQRRRSELLWWSAGVGAWAVYFLAHAHLATRHITAADLSSPTWIRFGGPRFLVETTQMGLLCALPYWVSAVSLTLMLLGVAAWVTGIGKRVAAVVAVYMAIFCVVGTPLNFYWGAITNPLLAFGLVWLVPAGRDLAHVFLGAADRRRGPLPEDAWRGAHGGTRMPE